MDRNSQVRIFAITWLSYAGYYLCRKNLSVMMPLLERQAGFTKDDLANIIFAYSLLYACGQFTMGLLSDRFGARLMVTAGMLVAGISTVAMGFSASPAAFLVLQAINGLAQACGWSGLVKIMAAWFDRDSRGIIMGWWSTNYVLGGFLSTLFATAVITGPWFAEWGWKKGAWAPGALLILCAVVFGALVRNEPAHTIQGKTAASTVAKAPALHLNREVRMIALAYFSLKLTRYAFIFWLPTYLVERAGFTPAQAGYSSSVYELVGFSGTVLAGYLSDRVFGSRRFPVGSLMMFGLAAAFLLPMVLRPFGSWTLLAAIALIGMLTFGPDTLMGGVAAQDSAGPGQAASVAGFINGVGSAGQILSPYVVAWTVNHLGWDALFYCFVVLSLGGAMVLATRWNYTPPAGEPAIA